MKRSTFALLAGMAALAPVAAGLVTPDPAAAQISVFDPTNYAQNILQAARALQQINNQIQSLQNQASMLQNMARNLSRIDFPQLQALEQRLQQINQLMGQAQGIDFRVDQLDARMRALFPQNFDALLSADQRVAAARARLDAATASIRQTMSVQSGIAENVRSDAQTLAEIVGRSQNAEGALQASQATNQLLALATQQQLQLQQLLAAQFRSESIDQARRAQAEQEGRETTRRFLGDGHAWTPR